MRTAPFTPSVTELFLPSAGKIYEHRLKMLIYKDIITGAEVLTDIYKFELIDDVIYKVKGKMVTETTDIDDAAIGGNASAEGGADEGAEASSKSGINIVLQNRLTQCYSFDKKSYKPYIKEYMKAIKDRLENDNPTEVPLFQKGCAKFVTEVIKNFKDYDLFQGEPMGDCADEGMVILLKWEDDENGDEQPYMHFFKHGLLEEKV